MRSIRLLAAVALVLPTLAQAQVYYYPTSAPLTGVSRASFVQMVMSRAGGFVDGTDCFTDVKKQSYAPSLCAAKMQGIITGDPSGRFRPDDSITFVEAAAVALRATGHVQSYDNPWYRPYLNTLTDWKAFPDSVNNIFYPINSSQAQELIENVFNADDSGDNSGNSNNSNDNNDDDDIQLTVSASESSADAGDTVTYTIRIKNNDNNDMHNLHVRAYLDRDFDFVSASDEGDYSNDRVEWDDIDVDERETETLTLKLRVSRGADKGDKLSFRVKVEDSEVRRTLTVSDDNHSNNDNNDDLRISISDSPATVEPGDTVTYTIRLENRDNDDVRTDVVAALDDDMVFVSASDGGDEDDDEVVWDNFFIGEDDTEVISLKVRIANRADDGDTVRLEVRADGEEDTETTSIEDNGSNNDDEDINISISDSPDPANPGDVVTYTIHLENNANDDEEVDVIADLDEDMSFVSASDRGEHHGNRIEWNNFELSEDDTETLTFRVQIPNSADDGDTLRVRVRAGGDSEDETTRIED